MKTLRTLFIFSLLLTGFACAPEDEDPYSTINGQYDVMSTLVEDSCPIGAAEELWVDLVMTVQERNEDDSYIVDIYLGSFLWQNVEVATDGSFAAVLDNLLELDSISGVVNPETIYARFKRDYIYAECALQYDLAGYKLMDVNPPPEGFEYR